MDIYMAQKCFLNLGSIVHIDVSNFGCKIFRFNTNCG